MAKLTDTALTILSSAAAREGGKVLPLPAGLKAPKAAVKKVLAQLLAGELLAAVRAGREDEIWTDDEECGRTTLVITPAGLAAIGIETAPDAEPVPEGKGKRPKSAAPKKAPARSKAAGDSAGTTKQETVLGLLRRREGATIAEMMAATGWQSHSVRGFLSGTVKTKMNLTVTSEKDKNDERRYGVASAKAGK